MKEIEALNEEIKKLGYKLSALLNVNCSFGSCILDPEVTKVQDKIKQVQDTKALLEQIKNNREITKKNNHNSIKELNKK